MSGVNPSKLLFGRFQVGRIRDAFSTDDTWHGFLEKLALPDEAKHIAEFIAFCEDWNELVKTNSIPDASESDRYSDLVHSRCWTVESPEGDVMELMGAPVFFSGGELTWKTREAHSVLRFHAAGYWNAGQTQIERVSSTWPAIPAVEELIDLAWKTAISRPAVHLFDGPMCRLEFWRVAPEHLELTLSETTYKKFLGTNLTNPELADRFGREVLANPVGVSPALITSDGFLMMGRRNASVAHYPHRVHPFAGALDPADADPFAAIERELAEELGFEKADIGEMFCSGIAEDLSIRQPELIFVVRTPRTRAEIEAAFDRTEHLATWATAATPEGIEAALGSGEKFTPVAVAAMVLYGRVAFGEGFFERYSSFYGSAK